MTEVWECLFHRHWLSGLFLVVGVKCAATPVVDNAAQEKGLRETDGAQSAVGLEMISFRVRRK